MAAQLEELIKQQQSGVKLSNEDATKLKDQLETVRSVATEQAATAARGIKEINYSREARNRLEKFAKFAIRVLFPEIYKLFHLRASGRFF